MCFSSLEIGAYGPDLCDISVELPNLSNSGPSKIDSFKQFWSRQKYWIEKNNISLIIFLHYKKLDPPTITSFHEMREGIVPSARSEAYILLVQDICHLQVFKRAKIHILSVALPNFILDSVYLGDCSWGEITPLLMSGQPASFLSIRFFCRQIAVPTLAANSRGFVSFGNLT